MTPSSRAISLIPALILGVCALAGCSSGESHKRECAEDRPAQTAAAEEEAQEECSSGECERTHAKEERAREDRASAEAQTIPSEISLITSGGIWDHGSIRLVQHSAGGVEHRVFIQWFEDRGLGAEKLVGQGELDMPINAYLSSVYSSGSTIQDIGRPRIVVGNIETVEETFIACHYHVDLNKVGVVEVIDEKCQDE